MLVRKHCTCKTCHGHACVHTCIRSSRHILQTYLRHWIKTMHWIYMCDVCVLFSSPDINSVDRPLDHLQRRVCPTKMMPDRCLWNAISFGSPKIKPNSSTRETWRGQRCGFNPTPPPEKLNSDTGFQKRLCRAVVALATQT